MILIAIKLEYIWCIFIGALIVIAFHDSYRNIICTVWCLITIWINLVHILFAILKTFKTGQSFILIYRMYFPITISKTAKSWVVVIFIVRRHLNRSSGFFRIVIRSRFKQQFVCIDFMSQCEKYSFNVIAFCIIFGWGFKKRHVMTISKSEIEVGIQKQVTKYGTLLQNVYR